MIEARITTLRSSRTLPGHGKLRSSSSAAGAIPTLFTFNEMFWKCPAIEVHPGRITSKGLFVQGPSDKFFADPAFARDEDGGIRLGHTLDHLHHPSHGCARDDGGQPENRSRATTHSCCSQ